MKPGYVTTEFWLSVIAVALTQLGALDVPDKYKWIVTRGAGAYNGGPGNPDAAYARQVLKRAEKWRPLLAGRGREARSNARRLSRA